MVYCLSMASLNFTERFSLWPSQSRSSTVKSQAKVKGKKNLPRRTNLGGLAMRTTLIVLSYLELTAEFIPAQSI